MSNEKHWKQFPFLQGDLYAQLKDLFPIRELLFPGDVPQELLINKAVYRFKDKKQYPLFQIGPGVLTLNTIEKEYEWEKYNKQITHLCQKFLEVYDFSDKEKITPSLSYYDFLEINWESENVLNYISENLNVDIVQHFHKFSNAPNAFNWGIGYQIHLGNFALRIDAGRNNKNKKGLIIQIQLSGLENEPNLPSLTKWLDEAHQFCSDLFKELTKGKLYDSFK